MSAPLNPALASNIVTTPASLAAPPRLAPTTSLKFQHFQPKEPISHGSLLSQISPNHVSLSARGQLFPAPSELPLGSKTLSASISSTSLNAHVDWTSTSSETLTMNASPPRTSNTACTSPLAPTVTLLRELRLLPYNENSEKRPFEATKDKPCEDDVFVPVSIGNNVLHIQAGDEMTIFSVASNSLLVEGLFRQQQGPLSYVGLTKSDSCIRLMRSFTIELFKSDQFAKFVGNRKDKKEENPKREATPADNKVSSENIQDEDSLVVMQIGTNRSDSPSHAADIPGIDMLPNMKVLYSMSQSKQVFYQYVESQMLTYLPRINCIHDAVNRFFQYVWPFVPILDQDTFNSEIVKLFPNDGFETSEFHLKISIKNDEQLSIAGILLLIIRLGYMTLISNDETSPNFTSAEELLIRDVTRFKSDHYLSIVNLCIPEEKVQARSTFTFVQGLTLYHFYRSVAPNDCLGLSGSDAQLLFGTIVNHALSIGLNRDPTLFDSIVSISKSPAQVNTWRSLWMYICNLDAQQAIYCGVPFKINPDLCDTEPPSYDSMAPEVSDFHKGMEKTYDTYRRIVLKITNLKNKPKVIDVLLETSELENTFLSIFGKDFFTDYVCSPAPEQPATTEHIDQMKHEESYMKVARFEAFIHIRANLSCLYYLIALHYEKKLDIDPQAEIGAGIELFKIFIRSVVQLCYIMSYALDNSQELFGKHYDYYLTAKIERSMIKTHNFISSFFIRLVNYKRALAVEEFGKMGQADPNSEKSKEFNERCEVVDSLFTICLIEAELFVGNFRTLSKTYINSYRLYVMSYFVLKQCMENPEKLFAGFVNKKRFFHEGTNMLCFLSIPELQRLCKLCEEFRIARLELIKRQEEHSQIKKLRPKPASDLESGHTIPAESAQFEAEDAFDAATANRNMYAKNNTLNTYGLLQKKHLHSDYLQEVFDEQSMIGNEELLHLFELYGDCDVGFEGPELAS